jgi:four helix bundle protein
MNDQFLNNQKGEGNGFNLEERTAQFAEKFIELMKKIPRDPINFRLIEQGVGAAGSIGANYCEADEAESRADFIHKMCIAKKEIKEVRHWIRLLAKANPNLNEEFRNLWREAQELLLIFSKIVSSSRKRIK